MKLSDWLAETSTTLPDFAARVGHSEAGVKKWLRGERFPRPDAVALIESVTEGHVTYRDLMSCRDEAESGAVRIAPSEAAE